MKKNINELGFLSVMRLQLGVCADNYHLDDDILEMTPMARVRLISAWNHHDRYLADTFAGYFRSQGLYLTTNPNADGVIV